MPWPARAGFGSCVPGTAASAVIIARCPERRAPPGPIGWLRACGGLHRVGALTKSIPWLTIHELVMALSLLVYIVTTHAMRQRRHPTAAIAWVLFILLVPYLALPAFLLFGSRKRVTRPPRPAPPPAGAPAPPWAADLAVALGQPQPAGFHALSVHRDGAAALTALWDVLDGAEHSIDVCTFILGRDDIGRAVIARLCAKARAGVRVRLMLDGVGSLMAGRPRLKSLTEAGGSFRLFVPPLSPTVRGRSNLRDHRKLLITDAAHATRRLWCGGRNLAAEYFTGTTSRAAWRDLSFDLGGDVVRQASALFEHDWAFAGGGRRARAHAAHDEDSEATLATGALAQLIASGPDQADDTIYALLLTATHRARQSIALVTPYFVPDSGLLLALCLAARRGVRVDLLLPRRSNHPLSDIARNRALRSLAEAGGQIWLAPQMLHAKLVVIDDTLALAGSANLDSRSLFLNYELMLAFHGPTEVVRWQHWFDIERASASRFVARHPGLWRDLAEGAVIWAGFQL